MKQFSLACPLSPSLSRQELGGQGNLSASGLYLLGRSSSYRTSRRQTTGSRIPCGAAVNFSGCQPWTLFPLTVPLTFPPEPHSTKGRGSEPHHLTPQPLTVLCGRWPLIVLVPKDKSDHVGPPPKLSATPLGEDEVHSPLHRPCDHLHPLLLLLPLPRSRASPHGAIPHGTSIEF